jgi:indole-3-glycerol phosphate synthase
MTYLADAADRLRRDLQRQPAADGSLLIRIRAMPPARPVLSAMRAAPGPALIAEARRTSPFPRAIGLAGREPGDLAERFERAGAVAVAVVTERTLFDGSISDIRSVRRRTALPIVQREAFVHPVQILQGRAEGADAVVLVAAIVSPAELHALAEVAGELGMDVLVQVHPGEDPAPALAIEGSALLVNARDPSSLEPDWERALALVRSARTQGDRPVAVEGGILAPGDVARCREAGAQAVVVGTALMRAVKVEEAVAQLMGA